jgi:uncharacterized protein
MRMESGGSVLIIPGLGDSGPRHWQSLWEASHPEYRRVRQTEWERPRCSDWVSPPDVEAETIPAGSTGFAPCPLIRLPFKSIVVASTNDPFATLERAKTFAGAWGSELVILESAGHINAASGHGPWPEGEGLLDGLMP